MYRIRSRQILEKNSFEKKIQKGFFCKKNFAVSKFEKIKI